MFLHVSQLLNWKWFDYCRAALTSTVAVSVNLFACFTSERQFPREQRTVICVVKKDRSQSPPQRSDGLLLEVELAALLLYDPLYDPLFSYLYFC